jgi:predicted acylesterase/phospholipase RssA
MATEATGLLLGGGAPTLTLQSGALAALHDNKVHFDVISTAGAGMLIGLLYAAPKGMSPRQALEQTKEMGVHDTIYDQFPVNFKVFHKPGTMADGYRRWLQSLPRLMPGQAEASRLFADWMTLMFAAWCPSDLSEKSQGLCDHAPWIDEVVDFDKLQEFPGEFYMNAYNITDGKMELFTKQEISPDHFRAALAFPFIYPPFKLNGKTYIEGSALDTLCFEGLLRYRDDRLNKERAGQTKTQKLARRAPLRNVVIFDTLSAKKIIREPRTLYDAWVQSIMIPLVEIAKDDVELFKYKYNKDWKLNLMPITFDIPDRHWPKVLDWSYSNLSTLYEIGYKAGQEFYRKNKEVLAAAEAQPDAAA